MIRAYNSLAEFSKSAQEMGIDIESHRSKTSRKPSTRLQDRSNRFRVRKSKILDEWKDRTQRRRKTKEEEGLMSIFKKNWKEDKVDDEWKQIYHHQTIFHQVGRIENI